LFLASEGRKRCQGARGMERGAAATLGEERSSS
jgi:hypothetical protein